MNNPFMFIHLVQISENMDKTKERRESIKVVQENFALRNKGLLRRVKIGLSHYFFLRKKPGETKT